MKKIYFTHLIILTLITSALSQNTEGVLQQNPTCFFVSQIVPKSNKHKNSPTYCIGDQIKVQLKDNQQIHGTLDHISPDHKIIVDEKEIETSAIQWFSTPGLKPGAALGGGVLIAGGAALIISANPTNLDLENGPPKVFIGIISMIGGLIVLTDHSIFRPEENAQWVFNH